MITPIREPFIKLDQFLKFRNIVESGGQAKLLIQSGEVAVNGICETRRGRKLVQDDQVTIQGQTWVVNLESGYELDP